MQQSQATSYSAKQATLHYDKQIRTNRRSKEKKKAKRRRESGLKKSAKELINFRKRAITIAAPDNFSFRNEPELFINFLNKIENATKNKDVWIDVKEITSLSTDAVFTLLSIIYDTKFTHKRIVRGNYPKDPDLRRIWEESGFNDYVRSDFKKSKNVQGNIVNNWSNNVEAEYTAKLVEYVSGQFSTTRKLPKGIQTIYIELMSNTIQHASN